MSDKWKERIRTFYFELLNNTKLKIIDENDNVICDFGNIEYEIDGDMLSPKDDRLKTKIETIALRDGKPSKYNFVKDSNTVYNVNINPFYCPNGYLLKCSNVVITGFRISIPI